MFDSKKLWNNNKVYNADYGKAQIECDLHVLLLLLFFFNFLLLILFLLLLATCKQWTKKGSLEEF